MSLTEIFRSIFINIRENKTKVFLTTLGIIVGSITIVLVMAIGQGSQAAVEEQFQRLNVGTLQITPSFGRDFRRGGGGNTTKLSVETMETIAEEVPYLKNIAIMINGSADVVYEDNSSSFSVMGASPDIQEINNLELEYGEFITNEHNLDKERVAVLGSDVADLLFNEDRASAIGEKIIIKGKRYEVIGVIKGIGESTTRGFNQDEGIIVPYQVAESYITGRNNRPQISALVGAINDIEVAIEKTTAVLQEIYEDESEGFMIIDAGSRIESAKASARTMTLMLMSMATIVLIVGGIGIMNVLFVSVKERTKEIGILKAIGARKRDILLIFLFEAIIISALGGIIGIIGSIFIVPIVSYFDVRIIPTMFGYTLAFGFSVVVGTFFGYYPASRAAALKPIDALNYE